MAEMQISAANFLPAAMNLSALRQAAATCKGCNLWKTGTQTVFGEGRRNSKIMMVGEQPGDREDLAGRPFVGPAGRILDQALEEAKIDRKEVYVTNIVKHFKWLPDARGKRRIHKKPNSLEIRACRPWLDAEIRAVQPRILVCLGATASQALLGRTFSVTRDRGKMLQWQSVFQIMATVHPSSILRAPDSESRHAQMQMFTEDMRKLKTALDRGL